MSVVRRDYLRKIFIVHSNLANNDNAAPFGSIAKLGCWVGRPEIIYRHVEFGDGTDFDFIVTVFRNI